MSTIEHNLPLKSKNSFGVEVEARHWATFATAEELPALFEQIPAGMPWMVIGGGNNILFTQDYEGILLHPIGEQIQHLGSDATQAYVRADAGVEWDRLVEWTVSRGW
ncbi:MAG: FAD-binding protein, partial [Alistipes sp.]|nr:FAD-binding protein [Alistipes sp.]